MHIFAHEGSLEGTVESENMLLTGLTGLVGDVFLDGVTISKFHSLQSLNIGGESGDGGVGDAAGEGFEVGGGSYEVGFAAQAYENSLSTVDTAEDGTLGGFVLTALCEGGFTFLTKDFNSTLEVAFGFFEGLFAIHHAGAGHVTQLLDVC